MKTERIPDLIQTTRQLVSEKIKAGSHISKTSNEDINRHVAEVAETGVSVITGYYSPEQCQAIIADIEKTFVNYKDFLWVDEEQADHRVHGSEKTSELIAAFHNDPYLMSIAEAFNGTKTVNFSTLCARLEPQKSNLGSGGGWHRDTAMETRQFKAIVYLTDVAEENGPFQYVHGTEKARSLYTNIIQADLKYAQNRLSEAEVEKVLQNKQFTLKNYPAKAGTVLLVNTFGIHRGMPIQKGVRYALTNYYYAEAFLDRELWSKKFNVVR